MANTLALHVRDVFKGGIASVMIDKSEPITSLMLCIYVIPSF